MYLVFFLLYIKSLTENEILRIYNLKKIENIFCHIEYRVNRVISNFMTFIEKKQKGVKLRKLNNYRLMFQVY